MNVQTRRKRKERLTLPKLKGEMLRQRMLKGKIADDAKSSFDTREGGGEFSPKEQTFSNCVKNQILGMQSYCGQW
jgi:hypothetical protein